MSFIRLTKISSNSLKLRTDIEERNFKGRYQDAVEDDDNEKIAQIFSDFHISWVPYGRSEVTEVLINTDCIEICVEEFATSPLISAEHIAFLPRISKVFLKGRNDGYLVLESALEIKESIENAKKK